MTDTPEDADLPDGVTVEGAGVGAAGAAADLWVDLARGQRVHGSHLVPEANHSTARDEIARQAVLGGLFVARGRVEGVTDGDDSPASTDGQVDGADGDGDGADDRLLGFVTASVETPGYEQTVDRGLVHNLYVRPAVRGRGIGGALLEAAERHLREDGVDRIALEAMADNEAARRFYRRHGYVDHRVQLEKPVDR